MKEIVFVLSIVLLSATACGRSPRKQTANEAMTACTLVAGDPATSDTIGWDLLAPKVSAGDLRGYDAYEIRPKESGAYFCLSAAGKEYEITDIFDYGEIEILVYTCGQQQIIFAGMIDTYGSTYFVYHVHDDRLFRLGDVSFMQPADVEEKGMRYAEFVVKQSDNEIFVNLYLDGIFTKREEFHLENQLQ